MKLIFLFENDWYEACDERNLLPLCEYYICIKGYEKATKYYRYYVNKLNYHFIFYKDCYVPFIQIKL